MCVCICIDLSQLVREASFAALRPFLLGNIDSSVESPRVSAANFDTALSRTNPSVSAKDFKMYSNMQLTFQGSRSKGAVGGDVGEGKGV